MRKEEGEREERGRREGGNKKIIKLPYKILILNIPKIQLYSKVFRENCNFRGKF